MAEPARSLPRSSSRVRPLSAAAHRRCSRPGCPSPAQATLTFRYDSRESFVTSLLDDPGPETYDLCTSHADRTRPPHGWSIEDKRPPDSRGELPTSQHLSSASTVAVLAAALHGPTDPPADDHAHVASVESVVEPLDESPRDSTVQEISGGGRFIAQEARTLPPAREVPAARRD